MSIHTFSCLDCLNACNYSPLEIICRVTGEFLLVNETEMADLTQAERCPDFVTVIEGCLKIGLLTDKGEL